MLCPFCLAEIRFKAERTAGLLAPVYRCPQCREQVPALYVRGYRGYPPVVTSAVGFRQHGKTVSFAALFYTLKKLGLPDLWPTFFTMALNEDSLDAVYENVRMLEEGLLPNSTPKNFPRPTMLRVEDLPLLRRPDWTMLFYDTGGESFERPTQLAQFAPFVRRACTAMLLISPTDMADPAREMQRLLNTYIVGLGELGGNTQEQHLVVVYTKSGRLPAAIPQGTVRWGGLHEYLLVGTLSALGRPQGYLRRLERVSTWLDEFTGLELQAYEFLNAARANFRSVSFAIVSALGSEPEGGRMPVQVAARRILDPLLLTMRNAQTRRWNQGGR
jgi:hypothetical protein